MDHIHSQRSRVKAMVFPVVMYGCESWTVNKLFFYQDLNKVSLVF